MLLLIFKDSKIIFRYDFRHHLTGQWIPPNERSKFVSSYLGSSIGTAIAYPFFGFIIKATSWEWVFHSCGIAGIIWYILWRYFVSGFKFKITIIIECFFYSSNRSMIHLKNIHESIRMRKSTFLNLWAIQFYGKVKESKMFHGRRF